MKQFKYEFTKKDGSVIALTFPGETKESLDEIADQIVKSLDDYVSATFIKEIG